MAGDARAVEGLGAGDVPRHGVRMWPKASNFSDQDQPKKGEGLAGGQGLTKLLFSPSKEMVSSQDYPSRQTFFSKLDKASAEKNGLN